MLRNYVATAWRSLLRDGVTSAVNLTGLTLAVSCALLAALFVRHEYSYDRFHERGDRLYRLAIGRQGEAGGSAAMPPGLAGSLRGAFPEIVRLTRVEPGLDSDVRADGKEPIGLRILQVDADFAEMFSFAAVDGDPRTLSDPATIVLTDAAAGRLFGATGVTGRNAVARIGSAGGGERRLTVGAMLRVPPATSTLRFDALVGLEPEAAVSEIPFYMTGGSIYLELAPGVDVGALEAKLSRWLDERNHVRWMRHGLAAHLQPLPSLHLDDAFETGLEPRSRPLYAWILAAIAAAVLGVAAINYVNTAVSRGLQRTAEVGMRKALGARRGQLAWQFAGEAVLTAAVAFVLALGLTELVLPTFAALAGRELALTDLASPSGVAAASLVFFVVSLGAAAYPALRLSSARPAAALHGRQLVRGGGRLQRGLLGLQLSISCALATAVVVMAAQARLLRDFDLGFAGEQVVVVSDPLMRVLRNAEEGAANARRMTVLQRRVQGLPGVVATSRAADFAGGRRNFTAVPLGGTDTVQVRWFEVDPSFAGTLGLRLRAGRDLSPDAAAAGTEVIVNATLAQRLGGALQVVGVESPFGFGRIVGVVDDFHYEPLHNEVGPAGLVPVADRAAAQLLVRLSPQGMPSTLASIRNEWHHLAPDRPLSLRFLDDDMDALYATEERWISIVEGAAAVAVLVACLGVFGLSSLAAARRRRETGVRKVLGATVVDVVSLFSGDFARTAAIACLLAAAPTWLALDRWLQGFAYRVEPGVQHFGVAAALTIGLVVAVVVAQSLRVALASPVDALRHE